MVRLATPWITAAVLVPFAVGLGVAFADGEAPNRAVMEFVDPEIIESSGLAVRDGLVATVNDSGDAGRTFVVDLASGETVGGVTWGEATDVEALAPTPDGGLLVGDIGDNAAGRDSVELIEVAFARGETSGEETRFRLTYPDGPADAEALLVHPVTGEVLVATKGIFAGSLYAAPAPLAELAPGDAGQWKQVAEVGSVITDGAFFPDGRHLILRDYSSASVYSFPGLERIGSFDLPEQQQGEGIAVDPDGRIYLSTEGQFTSLLRVPLPRDLVEIMAPEGPAPEGSAPEGSAPEGSAPEGSAPEDSAPEDSAPEPPVVSGDPGPSDPPVDGATQGGVPIDEVDTTSERSLWLWSGGVLALVAGAVLLVRSLRTR